MKILYYSPNPQLGLYDPSGYGTHMREMIAAMQDLGHEVIPFIAGGQEQHGINKVKPASSFAKRISKLLLPSYIWSSLRDRHLLRKDHELQKKLLQIIHKEQPDLIYERGSHLQLSGVEAAKQVKIRHVLEVNAPLAEEKKLFGGSSWYDAQADASEKKLLSMTSRVLVVSSALKSYFLDRYGLDAERFTVVPNAVHSSNIMLDTEGIDTVRLRYNLVDKTVIGFVGSIFPWHGVDLMIKAFAEVALAFPNVVLLIVGDGVVLPELKQLAIKLDLADRIHFTGNVPHLRVTDHIACMDICVMAKSNWYGSPVKIFEYGVLGKAIVAPNTAPVAEVMEHGKDGLLVAPTSAEIKSAITLFLEQAEARSRMGMSFQTKVKRNHTWRINAMRSLEA